MNAFFEKLAVKAGDGKRLCIGLDPVPERIPEGVSVSEFLRQVIEATSQYAAAFKPNIAFYEGRGEQGLLEYAEVVSTIRSSAPGVPIIGDWKRGDIGETNLGYIQAAFENFDVDALTVHPYLGEESLRGFLDRGDKAILILCRTTNPGAGEFQDLNCEIKDDPCKWAQSAPLYQIVAHRVSHHWSNKGNCGLVVGATYPDEIAKVRGIAPGSFFLIPGVGTQGGDLEASVRNAYRSPVPDFVINVSSGISYAYEKGTFQAEPVNFAKAAAKAAEDFDRQIRNAIPK